MRLSGIYERAIVSASRMARGNSGTLLCAWGLEAVRSYWGLPGNLAQELGPEAEELPLLSALARDEARVRAAHAAASGSGDLEAPRGFDYAVAEARAMACAAERVRASVGEQMAVSYTHLDVYKRQRPWWRCFRAASALRTSPRSCWAAASSMRATRVKAF